MTTPSNPANKPETRVKPKGFQPMAVGAKQLEVPEKIGYQRRWFRSDPGRIARAQRAGWTFVEPEDVDLENKADLGGDAKVSGNTDLGTRVSVISGDGMDGSGQPSRLYLMEIPDEWYQESRAIIEERNEGIAEALTAGSIGDETNPGDTSNKYRKGKTPDLFIKKKT